MNLNAPRTSLPVLSSKSPKQMAQVTGRASAPSVLWNVWSFVSVSTCEPMRSACLFEVFLAGTRNVSDYINGNQRQTAFGVGSSNSKTPERVKPSSAAKAAKVLVQYLNDLSYVHAHHLFTVQLPPRSLAEHLHPQQVATS